MNQVIADDFLETLDMVPEELPVPLRSMISEKDFRYSELTKSQREECLKTIRCALESKEFSVSGPHNKARWEQGWEENLRAYRDNGQSPKHLMPKYFKSTVVRYRNGFIRPASGTFEFDFYGVVLRMLSWKYLSASQSIIEFGCGTGANLLALSDIFPDKRFVGCDWTLSSQSILRAIREKTGKKIEAIRFDMFSPGDEVPWGKGCAVLTVAAMEQLGSNFHPFLNYLIDRRPAVCVHLEPILELYGGDSPLDHVAKRYHERRGYLSGFLTKLKTLEAEGKITLLKVRRLFFGGFYHEGNSVIVWKPV